MTATATSDVVDTVLGLAPDSPLAQLRRQRADVVRHTEGSYAALFEPRDAGGITKVERLAAALRIAELNQDAALAGHYRKALADTGQKPPSGDARWSAMLRHVERVSVNPRGVTPGEIAALQSVLATRDVVTLSQLIAFVNYQVRVLAGLRLLQGAPR